MKHLILYENYPYLVDEEFFEDRKLLLLDLDSTLIFETNTIIHRPHVIEFLNYAFKNYRVGVFTARQIDDARAVLQSLNINESKLDGFYTEDDCLFDDYYIDDNDDYSNDVDDEQYKPQYYIKDLRITKEDLSQVIIIDDIPEGCYRNPRNLIAIKPFMGEYDNELLKIIPLLEDLKEVDDIRIVRKTFN